jgi:threonylcarbamoyladenosine tRNA methylthiotransferase MtaB
MKKFTIITLGCKVNQCESAALTGLLESAGCKTGRPGEKNDMVILNTCTVTGKAAMQSRQAIRQAVRNHPGAKIVVTGCYAQTAPHEIQQIDGVDFIVGHGDKLKIPELVSCNDTQCATPALVHHDIMQARCFDPMPSVAPETRTRAFLKIQDGCNAFCTYCIVPHARGRSRSMPPKDVRMHLNRLAQNGFQEVVLTGIHLGAYGKDLEPKTSLNELLASIAENKCIARIRISSIEPTEVDADLINLMASPKSLLCPHLHIPLQSGDNAILKRMARPYDSERFCQTIAAIHRNMPFAAIGVDILVGFPGEDEEAFNRTETLIEKLPVSYLHVFPFSPRKGTPAAGFKFKVQESVVKERCSRLRRLGEEKKARFYRANIGRVVNVLIESIQSGFARGLSENYLQVVIPGDQHAENSLVSVCINKVEQDLTVVGNVVG